MSRTTYDIRARLNGPPGAIFDNDKPVKPPLTVMGIVEQNNAFARHAGKGYWNDPDMMVTGDQGLTDEEQKAHFALWCVMTSPLFLGNDPRHLSAVEKEILVNRECIAVNQDPTEQGRRIRADGRSEIWVKRLRGNRAAVILLNRDPKASRAITLRAADLGLDGRQKIRDLFARRDLGSFTGTYEKIIPAHACAFLLIGSE